MMNKLRKIQIENHGFDDRFESIQTQLIDYTNKILGIDQSFNQFICR